jgi:hypothetical protein
VLLPGVSEECPSTELLGPVPESCPTLFPLLSAEYPSIELPEIKLELCPIPVPEICFVFVPRDSKLVPEAAEFTELCSLFAVWPIPKPDENLKSAPLDPEPYQESLTLPNKSPVIPYPAAFPDEKTMGCGTSTVMG